MGNSMRKMVLPIVHLAVFSALLLIPAMICLSPVEAGKIIEPIRPFPQSTGNNLESSSDFSFAELGGFHFDLVRRYSLSYGVDFRIILAIIKQESQFNSEALSDRGARGFMQLMPVTNAEIAEELQLSNPELPKRNLKAGIYYFAKLYELFKGLRDEDRLSFTLAAYNAGPGRIYDAQELAAFLGEDPTRWVSIQNVLPLLSKRYYSLHQIVWEKKKPRSGYFGEWRQTLEYVGNVSKTYRSYLNQL